VKGQKRLDPDDVRDILLATAADHECPAGGVEDYTDEGRTPDFNAVCDGTTTGNGLYGEGIVDAVDAVQERRLRAVHLRRRRGADERGRRGRKQESGSC